MVVFCSLFFDVITDSAWRLKPVPSNESNPNFHISVSSFIDIALPEIGLPGKSSFIKTLYADLRLKKGAINIGDFNLQNLNDGEIPYLRRELGIVFQDSTLLDDRSIYDNLKFVFYLFQMVLIFP